MINSLVDQPVYVRTLQESREKLDEKLAEIHKRFNTLERINPSDLHLSQVTPKILPESARDAIDTSTATSVIAPLAAERQSLMSKIAAADGDENLDIGSKYRILKENRSRIDAIDHELHAHIGTSAYYMFTTMFNEDGTRLT